MHYPLPSFYLYRNIDGIYEMVDGQQRTRAILGYHRGFFPDENKETIKETEEIFFYQQYKIAVFLIENTNKREIEDFYYRVNKFGSKLNRPEIAKAQYSSTPQQQLVEKLSEDEDFASLSLFTEASLNRLNDTDLISELLTLELLGNTDKKIQVDKKFYEEDNFSELDLRSLEDKFRAVLGHLQRFNLIYPLKKTRYRQRNDIYTLYGFLKEVVSLEANTLDYFYKILVVIDKDIYPSNENCYYFREYAENCVSQSNSKRARDERLDFFKNLLLNQDPVPLQHSEDEVTNYVIVDVLNFYGLDDNSLIQKSDYYVINVATLQEKANRHYFADGNQE